MSDIVSGYTFVTAEKNITATKMNSIVGGAVIDPSFYSGKPTASTINPSDQMLILSGGAYAQAPFSTVSSSVGASMGPQITAVRLRSFNAVGNSTFECDQISAGATVAAANGKVIDRWSAAKTGTLVISAGQNVGAVMVPNTNFAITNKFYRIAITSAQASLGASDNLQLLQSVEGPRFRELAYDVHSLQLLVRSGTAGLNFGVSLRDSPTTKSLTNICTISAANTWQLVTLPNLPVWPAGNFGGNAGTTGYFLSICLAAGATLTSPANGTWQTGNFIGALGQSNFAASLGTFDIAFVQHEPGATCTTPIDCPFGQNLDGDMGCERYYTKSFLYGTAPGAATTTGQCAMYAPAGLHPLVPVRFKKTMAKTPTVVAYSPATGAINIVRDATASAEKTATVSAPGDDGFGGFTVTSPNAGVWQASFHYVADTGW